MVNGGILPAAAQLGNATKAAKALEGLNAQEISTTKYFSSTNQVEASRFRRTR
jgi:hypothetical protein